MPVLPEERIVACLDRCLTLSQAILPTLVTRGTETVAGEELEEFTRLIDDLAAQRENDSYLSDESWNWIWKGKASYTYLQLYGRLAWIHYELFQLL